MFSMFSTCAAQARWVQDSGRKLANPAGTGEHRAWPDSLMAELRKQARSIENQLDAKLVQYSRLDTGSCGTSASSGRETPALLQRDIEQLLSQLGEVNDKMSRGMGEGGGLAASMHVLQRHREILHDFTQEFNKTRANLRASDERDQLLSSVQQDIRDARKSAGSGQDVLLRERNALQNTNRMTDDLVGQATAQLGALNEQRSTFGGIGSKLTEIAAASPQINAMIGYLARRKKRDKLVLGAVIGLCSGGLLWYSMS